MTPVESLITEARRYCMENYTSWSKRYSNETSGCNNPYSDNDCNLFPRYLVLQAMLQGVQTIVGQEFDSFDKCKDKLKKIALESHTMFTINDYSELHLLGKRFKDFKINGEQNQIERNAIQDERIKFKNFITELTPDSVIETEPLPYERKLSEEESESVREQLLQVWNVDSGYWEPLEKKSPLPTVFLMTDSISETDKEEIEKTIIHLVRGNRFYEINEDGDDYEMETASVDIELYESIICDQTYQWVVYGSHESTIAFGGKPLIDKVRELFADRSEKINKWEQDW